jgi:hypothetical protein
MRGIEHDIEETKFHIEGLTSIILSITTSGHRIDPSIVTTLNFMLELAHDRLDILVMMKAVLR